MNGRYFLDTNVFVYSVDARSPAKAKIAQKLIREAIATRAGVVSYQVVQEFFNVALRRFEQPMGIEEAQQYLSTVFRPILAVQSSAALFAEALLLRQRSRISWYDGLILAAALESKCRVLYSEDLQHGQRFGVLTIQNPFLEIQGLRVR